MRHYIRASELKAADMDWFDVLISEGVSPKTLLAARLKADESFPNEAARVLAFEAQGGGSRSSYFNYARRLRPSRSSTAAAEVRLANPRGRSPSLRVVGAQE
jgi:hypothetical protein